MAAVEEPHYPIVRVPQHAPHLPCRHVVVYHSNALVVSMCALVEEERLVVQSLLERFQKDLGSGVVLRDELHSSSRILQQFLDSVRRYLRIRRPNIVGCNHQGE